jgi:hypothetical protein
MFATPDRISDTLDSSKYWSIFGATRGVALWRIRRVERSLNNNLDLIPALALRAGGHRFDPGHVHQLLGTQSLKKALFCNFRIFWNLGTVTIPRALQKPSSRPSGSSFIPTY